MNFRSGIEYVPPNRRTPVPDALRDDVETWLGREHSLGWESWRGVAPPPGQPPLTETARLRRIIAEAVGDIFGVPQADLSKPSRGKARVALARQAAMYVAHVACGLSLTQVGQIFGRDRTTVAHACAVIEDRRDDPIFDRTLELMEWMVPAIVGHGSFPDTASSDI